MVNQKKYFDELIPTRCDIQVENRVVINSEGSGTVNITSIVNGVENRIIFKDVLYFPILIYNFTSISQARRKGYWMTVDDKHEENQTGGMKLIHKESNKVKVIGIESRVRLYEASIKVSNNSVKIATHKKHALWHEMIGQCRNTILRNSTFYIIGVNEEKLQNNNELCKSSVMEEEVRVPRKRVSEGKPDIRTTRTVERLHIDVV